MMKVLTVCGLGQGTSLILKMNVEQALGEKGIQADVEHTDVSAASSMSADYIITSEELAESLEGHGAKVLSSIITLIWMKSIRRLKKISKNDQ